MTKHVMREKHIAGASGNLSRNTEVDRRIRRALNERIGPALSQVRGDLPVRARPHPQVAGVGARLIGQKDPDQQRERGPAARTALA